MEPYQDEVVRKSAETKDLKKRFWLKVIAIAFLVSFLGGGAAVFTTYLTLRSAAEDGTQLAQQIKQACEEPGLTDPDLAQFCPKADQVVEAAPDQVKSDPVPGPPGPSGPAGETGTNGTNGTDAPAPTVTQIRLALSSLCSDAPQVCRSNKSITPAQVSVAVAAYCNSNGQCVGPKGATGVPGADGEDAPAVTSAQLTAAVSSYCATRNDCKGATGDTGASGQDGQDGQNGSDSTVPGPPGVVGIQDNCGPAPDGQVIEDVNASYDSGSQIITLNCTYKDDQQGGLLPANP